MKCLRKIEHKHMQIGIACCNIWDRILPRLTLFSLIYTDVYKDGLTCFCGKKFEKSASLTAHYLRVHDTEFTEDPIPEECHICGKQFKTKRKLRLHREGIHEGKRHKCHYCEKDFGHYFSLKKHISYEHEGTSAKIPCER